ncbi:MAG: tRNA (adenosine(37)-N6)-threonylcarbamoyltransferase complex dimerization subunit type 1 TsaB [bacterium]|nr:tRNA (adenosine(37)-N6)-threonylcarbamoyltransferase complex dimerization subunit type 1 TsaB [bacterium]
MTLYIDTTSAESVTLALSKQSVLILSKKFKAKYRQSEKLLPQIDKLLRQGKSGLKKISGIIVVKGPGPFTATRIGVATANALAFGLSIPVVGIKNTKFKNLEEMIKQGSEQLKKKNIRDIIEPFYDSEPNITKPKSINLAS